MDRITLLRAFVRIVDTGSFTETAAELRVKQSTVSKWMTALENEVGQRLIDRTTRSQRVTRAGERFRRHAVAIIAAYDDALSDVRSDAAQLRGHVRVSLPVVFGERYVVPRVVKLLRRHPDLEIDLVFGDRYVSPVEEGFDVVIRIGLDTDSTLRAHHLGEAARRLVASRGYLVANGTPQTPRDLSRHTCLVHTPRNADAVWTFRQPAKRGQRARAHRARVGGRVSANSSAATAAMARAGLGIGLLADWLVDGDIRNGRLIQLLPAYQPPPAPIRALTPPGRMIAPRVRTFIESLRETP